VLGERRGRGRRGWCYRRFMYRLRSSSSLRRFSGLLACSFACSMSCWPLGLRTKSVMRLVIDAIGPSLPGLPVRQRSFGWSCSSHEPKVSPTRRRVGRTGQIAVMTMDRARDTPLRHHTLPTRRSTQHKARRICCDRRNPTGWPEASPRNRVGSRTKTVSLEGATTSARSAIVAHARPQARDPAATASGSMPWSTTFVSVEGMERAPRRSSTGAGTPLEQTAGHRAAGTDLCITERSYAMTEGSRLEPACRYDASQGPRIIGPRDGKRSISAQLGSGPWSGG
jgi:hypothetical protein